MGKECDEYTFNEWLLLRSTSTSLSGTPSSLTQSSRYYTRPPQRTSPVGIATPLPPGPTGEGRIGNPPVGAGTPPLPPPKPPTGGVKAVGIGGIGNTDMLIPPGGALPAGSEPDPENAVGAAKPPAPPVGRDGAARPPSPPVGIENVGIANVGIAPPPPLPNPPAPAPVGAAAPPPPGNEKAGKEKPPN